MNKTGTPIRVTDMKNPNFLVLVKIENINEKEEVSDMGFGGLANYRNGISSNVTSHLKFW